MQIGLTSWLSEQFLDNSIATVNSLVEIYDFFFKQIVCSSLSSSENLVKTIIYWAFDR